MFRIFGVLIIFFSFVLKILVIIKVKNNETVDISCKYRKNKL